MIKIIKVALIMLLTGCCASTTITVKYEEATECITRLEKIGIKIISVDTMCTEKQKYCRIIYK